MSNPLFLHYIYTINAYTAAHVVFFSDGGHNDTGEYWKSWYETDTFETDLQNLLAELQPLYESLHSYVRSKLASTYRKHHFPRSGHIPAHLLGKNVLIDINLKHLLRHYLTLIDL